MQHNCEKLIAMIYDWRKIEDLKKASIFDLTDDLALIRKCTCLPSLEMTDSKEYIAKMTESTRVGDFEAFAYETRDEELAEHLKMTFSEYYEKLRKLPEGAFWE